MEKRLLCLFAALLIGGCSTATVNNIKRQTGYDASVSLLTEVEQPYEETLVHMPEAMTALHDVTIAMNPRWIGDAMGYYFEDQVDRQKKFVMRDAWRVIAFDESANPQVYSALLSPFCTEQVVLIPNESPQAIMKKQLLILSGSGRIVMTTQGEIVRVATKDLLHDRKAQEDFFREHPSPVSSEQINDISPGTPAGDAFLKYFLQRYPGISQNGEYRGNLETLAVAPLLNESTVIQKIIAKGHVTISPLMFAGGPAAALPFIRLLWAVSQAAKDETLKGSFFEGTYTGEEIGETLGYCLENNARFRRAFAPEVLHDAVE